MKDRWEQCTICGINGNCENQNKNIPCNYVTNNKVKICKYKFQDSEKYDGKPYCTCFNELCEDLDFICDNNCQVFEEYRNLIQKERECEQLKYELSKRIESLNELDLMVESYRLCFEGALGAIQALIKKDLTNKETLYHYASIALHYLSFRYEERRRVPNKYKKILEEIKEKCKNNNFVGFIETRLILDIINKFEEKQNVTSNI